MNNELMNRAWTLQEFEALTNEEEIVAVFESLDFSMLGAFEMKPWRMHYEPARKLLDATRAANSQAAAISVAVDEIGARIAIAAGQKSKVFVTAWTKSPNLSGDAADQLVIRTIGDSEVYFQVFLDGRPLPWPDQFMAATRFDPPQKIEG